MRLLVVGLLWALAPRVAAQLVNGVDISHLPVCAQGCLANNTNAAAGCSITDVKCICQSIPYINALSCCLQKQCSSEEQQAALAFDIALCNQYNVSIPDFLGCSPLSMSGSRSNIATASPLGSGSLTAALAATSTVVDLVPLVSTPTSGPVAPFSGAALLTSTCTNLVIATTTLGNGGFLGLPWVGCGGQKSGTACCPYDPATGGALTACPTDYTTTAGACCPTGWTVATSTIAGHLPCYTTPALPLVAPSNSVPAAGAPGAPAPSVASGQLYTLRYPLAPPSPTLSGGAIAGIAIGSIVGAALLALAIFALLRARRRRAADIRAATVPRGAHLREAEPEEFSPTGTGPKSPTTPGSAATPVVSRGAPLTSGVGAADAASTHPSELPSPPLANSPTAKSYWSAGASATPVMELPGSTHMLEHHPALLGGRTGSPTGGSGGAVSLEPGYWLPFASMERIPSLSGSPKD